MSVDSTQYEQLAAIYESVLRIPARRCDILNFLATAAPHLRDARVLDLATGTGYFARAMARRGAAHVVGVDVSEGMLSVARNLSSSADEVHYQAGDVFSDALELEGEEKGSFDLVTGVWCLNYAGDKAAMQRAWGNIAAFLRPDGRFVGIVPNEPTYGWLGKGEKYYGLSCERLGDVVDGRLVRMTMHAETMPVVFETYVLREDVYRDAAEKALMVEVRLQVPVMVPELEEGENEEYWKRYLGRPNFKVMTAVKGRGEARVMMPGLGRWTSKSVCG